MFLCDVTDDNGELIRSEEGKSLSDSGVPITVPRLRHSALFPRWEEADQVKRARLPRNLYVQRTPEGQVQRLRMITPYERCSIFVQKVNPALRKLEIIIKPALAETPIYLSKKYIIFS